MVAVDTARQSALAVLGPDGRVVVVLAGADAAEAAEEWRAEGYDVHSLELDS